MGYRKAGGFSASQIMIFIFILMGFYSSVPACSWIDRVSVFPVMISKLLVGRYRTIPGYHMRVTTSSTVWERGAGKNKNSTDMHQPYLASFVLCMCRASSDLSYLIAPLHLQNHYKRSLE